MKYLVYNDISYLIHKKKGILGIILIAPVIAALLRLNNQFSIIDVILSSTWVNLNLENADFLSILMYLFNAFTFLYLIITVYIKDLDNNLEYIFLRVRPAKYIVQKSTLFIVLMVILKIIQYFLEVFVILLFSNLSFDHHIFILLVSDISYTILVQYIFLLLYFVYILFGKNILFLITLTIVLFVLIPKNIWCLRNYVGCMLLLLFLVLLFIFLIILKKSNKLIENL